MKDKFIEILSWIFAGSLVFGWIWYFVGSIQQESTFKLVLSILVFPVGALLGLIDFLRFIWTAIFGG